MLESIQCGRTEQFIWESFAPFGEVQIGGHDSGFTFIALGNQVMEVFISR